MKCLVTVRDEVGLQPAVTVEAESTAAALWQVLERRYGEFQKVPFAALTVNVRIHPDEITAVEEQGRQERLKHERRLAEAA
jgi:hypothetical protein